ncbi:glycosyltransferase family 4 protein [Nonomuraea aurantiaca]|uniref:glycosyltransferase family 4 protein n=1 Tax=Nonomuraea aurantiaca TaxID=2878562 RepID=UPI001CD97413|nr:glycosyltransferase family 4 protein [Nonomuraea aurantiaca]MCA2223139.1 glycosyltransferase family 4 protein [Nonomuraea aurantiaca]
MRIIRVSYRIPPEPGGKERHVECLTREQLKRGHEVVLAFRRGGVVPDGTTVLATTPTPVSRALAVKSDVLAFAAEVGRALRRCRSADLVHLHGDYVESAVLGPICRRLDLPLVLTVHAALSRRHQRFARMALRNVDACIAIGANTGDDLARLGVDPRRIWVTSSGLDLEGIAKIRELGDREPGLIVSVGSLDPMKNHDLLIAAFHAVRRTRPGLRLVIAGDGPQRERLRRLAGQGAGIELPGQLPRNEIYRLVRSAQVFVLASRRLDGKGEGVPTAALEALALGTPVIVSTDAALEPVVQDRETYRTFTSGSIDGLIDVLGSVLDDDEARHRMGALGPGATAALDWPSVAGRVEEWYGTALSGIPRHV